MDNENRICEKNYPKEYADTTSVNKFGYPIYRRRDNGRTITKKGQVLNNQWIVPYNPYLCQKYNCHINVEICSSIRSVKYLYKYIYKGYDRTYMTIRKDDDEIKSYLDARYVSASEACWRLFKFSLQERSHKVERLPVHLPNQQTIIFEEGAHIPNIVANSTNTKLTRYFDICNDNQENPEIMNLKYTDFPKFFIWESGKWIKRKQHGDKIISRLYTCSPRDRERFCLRILLTQIPGAISFESLRTINGHLFEKFEDAVRALGLLDEENHEFDKCLKEAALYGMPSQLRQLFASILLFCDPTELNPQKLFNDNYESLIEDYCRAIGEIPTGLTTEQDKLFTAKALIDIEKYLIHFGKNLVDFNLNKPDYTLEGLTDDEINQQNQLFNDEIYLNNELDEILAKESSLNPEQKHIYERIIQALKNEIDQKLFFVDGPGGCGKTFLFNLILAIVRRDFGIALAVASSGIAALLLVGGTTAHSRFKIPLNLTKDDTLHISAQFDLAELIRQTKLILWDEAPMTNKLAFEKLDKALQDIMSNNELFGGKVVLFGGDFRQILPVVVRGNHAQIINASLKKSYLWDSIEQLALTRNIRI